MLVKLAMPAPMMRIFQTFNCTAEATNKNSSVLCA